MSLLITNLPLATNAIKLFLQPISIVPTALRNYAARKGTRERKQKKKVKVEVKKVGFIPHNQRDKEKWLLTRPKRKFNDSYLPLPNDNVFVNRFYRWIEYPFLEAVQCHRETNHPDMYNKPNAYLNVNIELNMVAAKTTRFLDNFSRIVQVPHKFDHGEDRTVLAFTKSPEVQSELRDAGANLVGGVELIKDIQKGAISLHDFQHIIAHPNILPELVSLRGLMKRKFPNPKSGTLDSDLLNALNKFLHGINYKAVKDEYEKDFGLIETVIGTLDMDVNHLEENFASLVRDVYKSKPQREGSFIDRVLLLSPPSGEPLKVNYSSYVSETQPEIEEEEDEEPEAQAATTAN